MLPTFVRFVCTRDCHLEILMLTIKALVSRALHLLTSVSWLGPLTVRLTIGVAFVLTGWGKLHSLDSVTDYFTTLHIPMPHANAVMVSTIEFAGGILLILGLGTRIAALLLIGVMAVAILTAKLPEAASWLELFSTIELTYLVTFVWLAVAGGGAASLDRAVVVAKRRAGAVYSPAMHSPGPGA